MADVLLTAKATNGDGPSVSSISFDPLRNQSPTVFIYGTWGGATAKIVLSPDGVNWVDMPSGSFTANTIVNVPYTAVYIKINVSNVGTTSLNAVVL